jgi:hypothetical protein
MSRTLTVNLPHVVHETIDGETILIHMGTGTYYSLEGAGAEVWALLAVGVPGEEVVRRMRLRHEADAALVERTVGALMDELIQEELLTLGQSAPAPVDRPGETHGVAEPPAEAPFVAPVLHKYTDMQEFMLVDPLHDVEADAGWPHVKAG